MNTLYKILTGDDPEELERSVEGAILEGFMPTGGVAVQNFSWENERRGYADQVSLWAQAVIKCQ